MNITQEFNTDKWSLPENKIKELEKYKKLYQDTLNELTCLENELVELKIKYNEQ